MTTPTEEYSGWRPDFPRVPVALRVVGWVFVVAGLLSLFNFTESLAHDKAHYGLGVWGIFVGIGILRIQSHWRRWAIAVIWLGIALGVYAVFSYVLGHATARIDVFGLQMRNPPAVYAVALAAPLIGFLHWQHKVLTRPAVRKLFDWQAYLTACSGGRRFIDSYRLALLVMLGLLGGEMAWFAARTSHAYNYVAVDLWFNRRKAPYCDRLRNAADAYLKARGFHPTDRPAGAPEPIDGRVIEGSRRTELWYMSTSAQPLYVCLKREREELGEQVTLVGWFDVIDFKPRVAAAEAQFEQLVADLRMWWEQYQTAHPIPESRPPIGPIL